MKENNDLSQATCRILYSVISQCHFFLQVGIIFFGGCYWTCQDMHKVCKMTNLQILRGSLLDFPDFLDPDGPPRKLWSDATFLSEFV